MGQQIEAVFENGVFRPLQRVHLPEHHRVTLLLPAFDGIVSVAKNGMPVEETEVDEEVGYQPLPLLHCKTIRVRFRHTGDLAPLPYPIDEDEAEAFDEWEQP
jgi:predicted DNA-binding antitoxin AbrB/MazE fold protein